MRVQRGIKDNGNEQALSSTFLEIFEKYPKHLGAEPPYSASPPNRIQAERSRGDDPDRPLKPPKQWQGELLPSKNSVQSLKTGTSIRRVGGC